ncbi:MAG: hypothetical protein ABI959_08240 [Candidatus Dormiibacterota bacterium]
MRRWIFKARFLGVVVAAALVGMWPIAASAATAPALGAAGDYAVLADGTGLTCTDSTVAGPVGVSSSTTAVSSTRCKMQVQIAAGAYADFLTAYDGIANNLGPCDQTLTGTLADVTLGPGVYCFDAAATLTGTLTLIGGGPWIFEIGGLAGVGALTATSFTVVSDNPCNAYWWVRNAVTITTSAFQGTILGGGDITLTTTSLAGRALATGAVTMTGSNIFGCSGSGIVAKHHCNQGVGNGPEGCDPGNSNQGNPGRSNDELGGTPGNPGRKGGNKTVAAVAQVVHSSAATKSGSHGASVAAARGITTPVAGAPGKRSFKG